MNIYNSVLLDAGGIIQQVRTTFAARPTQPPIGKYISLYTFSLSMEAGFTQSFLPFRFHVDDGAHAALLEVILAGSHFIDRQTHSFAELVIAFCNGETEIDAELQQVLHEQWKIVGWRKAMLCDNEMVAFTLAGK